jgi:hypothetical protein
MKTPRKKTWDEKVLLVRGSFNRSKDSLFFARDFYENLFFSISRFKNIFKNSDFEHQSKA